MLSPRIYRLALGYEDLNDHEQLRHDPRMAVLSGRRKLEEPLAGKSTLNRLELPGGSQRYHKIDYAPAKIDALLCDLFIESHTAMPDRIVLDLDATDIPLYGHQPERFFHGYCDSYCYLPLYIFAGDQLLCARLRPANIDGLLPRGVDGLVRGRRKSRGLPVRSGAQQPLAEDRRPADVRGQATACRDRQGSARLYRVQLSNAQELGAGEARGCQGRVSGQGGESALRC
jgi:Transposase DDE domain group 1